MFFVIIGVCALVLGFFQVLSTFKQVAVIQKSVQSIKLPAFEIPDNDNKLQDISKLVDELKTDRREDLTDDWQVYRHEKLGIEISHPDSWAISADHSSASTMTLLQLTEKEEAGMHIELVSLIEKVTSAEKAIDAMAVKMKDVVIPKKNVMVGAYSGYEIIGTLCTSACTGSKEDAYHPFSVTYVLGESGQIFEIQYGESSNVSWKKYGEWKHYGQFKEIISTFNYTIKQ